MSVADQLQLGNLIVQIVITVAMLATFWIAFGQLRAMRQSTKGQNTLALVQFLQAEEVRRARTTVRKTLRTKRYEDWTPEERRDADMVCANYDVTGVLLFQENLAPPGPFLKNWGPSIRDCFEILHPHIAEMQKDNNSGPEYWDDFGRLYAEAQNHSNRSDKD